MMQHHRDRVKLVLEIHTKQPPPCTAQRSAADSTAHILYLYRLRQSHLVSYANAVEEVAEFLRM